MSEMNDYVYILKMLFMTTIKQIEMVNNCANFLCNVVYF